MTPDELAKQVEKEQAELAAAPIAPSAGTVARCYFCGAVTRETQFVERVDGFERHRGIDCCAGGRFQ